MVVNIIDFDFTKNYADNYIADHNITSISVKKKNLNLKINV